VSRVRRTHDVEYLPLMRQGSWRLSQLVRVEEGEGRLQAAASAGRGYVRELTSTDNRVGVGLAVVAVALVLLGGRGLLGGDLPVMREFVATGDSPGALVGEWWSGWREAGFGEASLPPLVVPGLGLLGTVLLGSLGLARRLLLVAPLFVGALGAWKLLVATGSVRARAAMLAAYGLNPVALNAMAEGRLQALVAYAAAPWLLRRVATRAAVAPFVGPARPVPMLRHAAGTGLGLSVVGAVTPLGALVVVVCALVLAGVVAAGGARREAGAMAGATGAGVLCSLPLVGPWVVVAAWRGDGASLTGLWSGSGPSPSATQLVTGDVGPVVVGVFGWGLVVAAAYALLTARSWRFTWAVGGWVLAGASWVVATLLARGELLAGAGAELVLVPAALGMALSVAMGALAFERDVVGSDFGLPQVLSGVAALALVVALFPVAVAAGDGRWYLPEGDFDRVLALVEDGDAGRAVWIGDPDVLPVSGWSLDRAPGLAVGVTPGLDPTVTQRHRLDPGPGVEELLGAVDAAMAGETSRLGAVLAPMGVEHVVLIDQAAPQPFAPAEVPAPEQARAALAQQLDLAEVEGLNPAMALYSVEGAWPLRADVTGLGELGDLGALDLLQQPLDPPPAVLGTGPATRATGELDADRSIAQAVPADDRWSLRVDGEPAERVELFGWMQSYRTTASGAATLGWGTDALTRALQLLQVVWLVALVVLARRRDQMVPGGTRRRRVDRGEPLVVVTSEGDVLSPERDVSGGTAARGRRTEPVEGT
jgi:hypothetical protein